MTSGLKLNSHSGTNLFIRLDAWVLGVIAGFGILGSFYMFASNVQANQQNFNQFSSTSYSAPITEAGNDFDSYVKISGKKRVGNEIEFVCFMDIKAERYVMEMGDGMRMIITQPTFSYQYKDSGKYTLELKRIERGLISTIATKTIKVK